MNHPAVAPVSPTRHAVGWLVLAIDNLYLVLPQHEVRQIELLSDIDAATPGASPAIGWLARDDGDRWPAYGLDGTLHRQHAAATARRVCVFLADADRVFGIACDHVWSLAGDADIRPEPLPGCMTGRRSPITGFARYRDGIAAVTRAAALREFLASDTESGHGARQ